MNITRRQRFGLVGLTALACTATAGWARKYVLPPNATATSQIAFERSVSRGGFGHGSNQRLSVVSDGATCRLTDLALLSPFNGRRKETVVEAGHSMRLVATTMIYRSNGYRMSEGGCTNVFTFTPVAGDSYVVRQLVDEGDSCRIEVVSTATSQAPADLQYYNNQGC